MSSSDVKSMGRSLRHIQDPAARRIIETMLSNIDILKESIEALENPGRPEWLDMELQNGWVQSSSLDAVLPQYYKDSHGRVNIRGIIDSGTVTDGTLIARLPAGYRSSKIEIVMLMEDSGSGDAHLHLCPCGSMRIYNVTNNSEISLNGDFFAER